MSPLERFHCTNISISFLRPWSHLSWSTTMISEKRLQCQTNFFWVFHPSIYYDKDLVTFFKTKLFAWINVFKKVQGTFSVILFIQNMTKGTFHLRRFSELCQNSFYREKIKKILCPFLKTVPCPLNFLDPPLHFERVVVS